MGLRSSVPESRLRKRLKLSGGVGGLGYERAVLEGHHVVGCWAVRPPNVVCLRVIRSDVFLLSWGRFGLLLVHVGGSFLLLV